MRNLCDCFPSLALELLFLAAKELAMLRITTHDKGSFLTLKLEGRLAGPWVAILRDCWECQLARSGGQAINVDLRAVTFVDAAGRALLAEMSRQNARFHARDCQMQAILAEIARPCDETL
jgi:ABC-type transporter Mla MlaB component